MHLTWTVCLTSSLHASSETVVLRLGPTQVYMVYHSRQLQLLEVIHCSLSVKVARSSIVLIWILYNHPYSLVSKMPHVPSSNSAVLSFLTKQMEVTVFRDLSCVVPSEFAYLDIASKLCENCPADRSPLFSALCFYQRITYWLPRPTWSGAWSTHFTLSLGVHTSRVIPSSTLAVRCCSILIHYYIVSLVKFFRFAGLSDTCLLEGAKCRWSMKILFWIRFLFGAVACYWRGTVLYRLEIWRLSLLHRKMAIFVVALVAIISCAFLAKMAEQLTFCVDS